MNNRRTFFKTALLAGGFMMASPWIAEGKKIDKKMIKRATFPRKNWIWINPNKKDVEADLVVLYKKYKKSGIHGILFESDSEMHFRTAKAQGLEAHRWVWTVNRGEKTLLEAHPEWYAVNRKGESCSDKPPYVGYYRWLCPSREEVRQYLLDDMRSQLEKDSVDGIHLDYVRYCDVILPVNLWKKYSIVQTSELPEYDYCYCDVCKKQFQEISGLNLDEIEFPEASLSWRQYRYDRITRLVNDIAELTGKKKKSLTAAVFPTPEVAQRNVRQDWVHWNLDGVFPMIYHGFYKEKVSWIGNAVAEGVRGLQGRFPLYAGLHLPDFNNVDEIKEGIHLAMENGASGVSLFGKVTDEILEILIK